MSLRFLNSKKTKLVANEYPGPNILVNQQTLLVIVPPKGDHRRYNQLENNSL